MWKEIYYFILKLDSEFGYFLFYILLFGLKYNIKKLHLIKNWLKLFLNLEHLFIHYKCF